MLPFFGLLKSSLGNDVFLFQIVCANILTQRVLEFSLWSFLLPISFTKLLSSPLIRILSRLMLKISSSSCVFLEFKAAIDFLQEVTRLLPSSRSKSSAFSSKSFISRRAWRSTAVRSISICCRTLSMRFQIASLETERPRLHPRGAISYASVIWRANRTRLRFVTGRALLMSERIIGTAEDSGVNIVWDMICFWVYCVLCALSVCKWDPLGFGGPK